MSKPFKTEICAIAHRYFTTDLVAAPVLVAALQALINARPTVLPAVVIEAAAAPVPVAAAVAASDCSDEGVDGDPAVCAFPATRPRARLKLPHL